MERKRGKAKTRKPNQAPRQLAKHPGMTRMAVGARLGRTISGVRHMEGKELHPRKIDGVWTSGVDYTVVNAFRTTHHKLVPIVGADNNEFVHQLLTVKGLVGAVVTNPPPVGGAGAAVAIKVLSGQHVAKTQLLVPQVWTNLNAMGLSQLRLHRLPSRPPSYGASWNVPGYTTYSKQRLLACG